MKKKIKKALENNYDFEVVFDQLEFKYVIFYSFAGLIFKDVGVLIKLDTKKEVTEFAKKHGIKLKTRNIPII